ncbi:histidine phosphatase family protein [Gordonia sp. TBRC 11910]|uniref:Histidine phosphatase family protein n=1 Tax=Gordonia asplenii TaxID=2725283 RepID=A0A848L7L9_9ACTN|nr:histidine phosphatase family protein [Gordonia asplenii]NMO04481.1 histidine phosphatase family protein [Gordonia asplenii]
MSSTIYLVRHAETVLNADGKLRGLADPDLNENGRRQAEALAAALADSSAGVVVSSPLRRARETAQAIATAIGVPAEVDEDLNDRDYGQWTGHPKDEVVAQWGSVDDAPGVEPVAEVMSRARPALFRLAARAETTGRPVVLVTHDAVIRPLLALIGVGDATVPTASYQVLSYVDGEMTVQARDQVPDAGD